MDPSEELQQLRARIALLERQKTINTTPTSSRASFDLMAQNENEMGYAADTLCGQNDEIVPINGKKAMADQQQEEEQTKADQMEHLRGKIKQIELELNDMKQLNAELLARIEELECKQKADQQKEHRAKIDERQQEGGRGGGQGGSGFGRPNRDNEGGLSNDFSGGGGGSDESDSASIQILDNHDNGGKDGNGRVRRKAHKVPSTKLRANTKSNVPLAELAASADDDSFVVDTEAVEDEANNSAYQQDQEGTTSSNFNFSQVISHHTVLN
uniref:PRKC apoptosis WT1 regulator protein n=1 Tax=Globodera pallida TaxID=36090 RepID=A0A183BY89_GLOPA